LGQRRARRQRPRFPACTLIPVPKLALPGMLIEVEATAALPMAMGAKAAIPA
jgi:enamine deaminase RidA (YjgF/YER057c/UK114 family)